MPALQLNCVFDGPGVYARQVSDVLLCKPVTPAVYRCVVREVFGENTETEVQPDSKLNQVRID